MFGIVFVQKICIWCTAFVSNAYDSIVLNRGFPLVQKL